MALAQRFLRLTTLRNCLPLIHKINQYDDTRNLIVATAADAKIRSAGTKTSPGSTV